MSNPELERSYRLTIQGWLPKKYWNIGENITLKALFLSLFITENCLSLALTVSPKETLGAFFAFCNHGWSALSEQEML